MFHIKNIINRTKGLSLLASLGFVALLCVAAPALAADAPSLGTAATFGVLAGTYVNTVAGTTITGDLGYTTGPAVTPTVNGTTYVADATYNQAGTDQTTALAALNLEPCTSLGGGAVNLDNVTGHTTGIYTPGCYSSGGAMNITANQIVTLNGAGVYIFRPNGALTAQADTQVVLTGGACESDVYWTPVGATTLLENTIFAGTIFRGVASGLSITLENAASLTGRALAFGPSSVTTNGANTITVPTCAPVPPAGGVEVSKVFDPSIVSPGGVSTLTITFSNNNAGLATLDTDFVDNLPGGMTTVGLPTTTCGGTPPTVTATSVTLPVGATIPGGTPGTCTLMVDVTVADVGSFPNLIGIGDLQVDITDGDEDVSNTIPVSVILFGATGIPTLNEWGMIIFMALAGLGSVYYLRKRRRV